MQVSISFYDSLIHAILVTSVGLRDGMYKRTQEGPLLALSISSIKKHYLPSPPYLSSQHNDLDTNQTQQTPSKPLPKQQTSQPLPCFSASKVQCASK